MWIKVDGSPSRWGPHGCWRHGSNGLEHLIHRRHFIGRRLHPIEQLRLPQPYPICRDRLPWEEHPSAGLRACMTTGASSTWAACITIDAMACGRRHCALWCVAWTAWTMTSVALHHCDGGILLALCRHCCGRVLCSFRLYYNFVFI